MVCDLGGMKTSDAVVTLERRKQFLIIFLKEAILVGYLII